MKRGYYKEGEELTSSGFKLETIVNKYSQTNKYYIENI